MPFPDNCLRGIPNKDFLVKEDGSASAHLFFFSSEQSNREDEWIEQSINWEDDGSVIQFTLNQKKDSGDSQFKAGIAKIPRREIDRLNRLPSVNGVLSYERSLLETNQYHGNLLLKNNVAKLTMKKIAASLAMLVSEIIPAQEH